jgi:transposase InsO family protein
MKKSRAAYYKQMSVKARESIQASILRELVLEQRQEMPRLGGRKLYHQIRSSIQDHQLKIGRDRLFEWLRENDLLVRPKRRYAKTTNSSHRFRVHENLLIKEKVERPDQAWVCDITYLRLTNGFCYLALITDVYSRKIIGHHVNDILELKGCMKAFEMACSERKQLQGTIHHSDRGIQYCSNTYVNLLRHKEILISMAEAGNCYENAIAERVNGILKNEFNLDAVFKSIDQAKQASDQAIRTYNEKRPHMSIGMKKPIELYAA